jgi:hypothetical protein
MFSMAVASKSNFVYHNRMSENPKMVEARVLLKMFDFHPDTEVRDTSGDEYRGGKAPWKCYKVLVGPKWRRTHPVRRHERMKAFKKTLSYNSPEALYEGVKRLIARTIQS